MKITFSFSETSFFVLIVQPDETLQQIKTKLQRTAQIPANQIELSYKGRVLSDNTSTPSKLGWIENDIVTFRRVQISQGDAIKNMVQKVKISNLVKNLQQGGQPQQPPVQAAPRPEQIRIPDPDVFKAEVLATPDLLTQLLHSDPVLAEAVLSDDNTLLISILQERAKAKQLEKQKEFEEIERLNSNPWDAEAQAKIEERIREENVMNNMENAMEHMPEAFGRVAMLYIPCVVNGVSLQAFVDSGAEKSIMSSACAKRCGILRLIDTRFAGVAQGVGSAPILGRVHLAPLKIGNSVFPCSFTILDGQKNIDFLFGLDMLKRYQCCINLKENVLQIGEEKIQFLSEGEIEDKMNEEAEEAVKETVKESLQETKMTGVESHMSEDKITAVISMGYSRDQALEALNVSDGNVENAVSYLLDNANR